mmetsp:Transcript_2252/g.4634  ORF Transcript_2252/g.4634 Transcript_2252/m.4634 type:complete len:299 (-) Transcript_2252:717-1613(-)
MGGSFRVHACATPLSLPSPSSFGPSSNFPTSPPPLSFFFYLLLLTLVAAFLLLRAFAPLPFAALPLLASSFALVPASPSACALSLPCLLSPDEGDRQCLDDCQQHESGLHPDEMPVCSQLLHSCQCRICTSLPRSLLMKIGGGERQTTVFSPSPLSFSAPFALSLCEAVQARPRPLACSVQPRRAAVDPSLSLFAVPPPMASLSPVASVVVAHLNSTSPPAFPSFPHESPPTQPSPPLALPHHLLQIVRKGGWTGCRPLMASSPHPCRASAWQADGSPRYTWLVSELLCLGGSSLPVH